jgi:hypothetical protein
MSISIISIEEYELEKYDKLNFYWDCYSYVDKKKLRKDFKLVGRIYKILHKMRFHSFYDDRPNYKINYLKADNDIITEHPCGDIIIVMI